MIGSTISLWWGEVCFAYVYMKVIQFLRDWTLIIAILSGIAGYFLFVSIPWLDSLHSAAYDAVKLLQPALIFMMLFITFCNINPHDIRPCKWHAWMLLIQSAFFVVIGLVLIAMPHSGLRVVLEGAMICFICPTATAAAVVTRKLGGHMAHITTYTILINIVASVLIPLMVPFVHPNPDINMMTASVMILGQVFPLLLFPLILAMLVRKLLPELLKVITSMPNLAFYLWAFSLALAITMTVRSMVHSSVPVSAQLGLVMVSLIACVIQFWLGRKLGMAYHDKITAGQAFGQKNTVFAIWLGYTFFSPVTSMAGGFYSIWHNIYNTWQIYRHEHPSRRNLQNFKNID